MLKSSPMPTTEDDLNEIIRLLKLMETPLKDEVWQAMMVRVKALVHRLPDSLSSHTFETTISGGRGAVYMEEWQLFGPQSSDFDRDRCAAHNVQGIFKCTFYEEKNGKRNLPDPFTELEMNGSSGAHSSILPRFNNAIRLLKHLKTICQEQTLASNSSATEVSATSSSAHSPSFFSPNVPTAEANRGAAAATDDDQKSRSLSN